MKFSKRGFMMHKHGHHHHKANHLYRSMREKSHWFKHSESMSRGSMLPDKKLTPCCKYFKGMQRHSSSDSDSNHGKDKHVSSGFDSHHHGKIKHLKGKFGKHSFDHHHHGIGKHCKGMFGRHMSSLDGRYHHGMFGRHMPSLDGHHHQGMFGRHMPSLDGLHHHGKIHFKGMFGRHMAFFEEDQDCKNTQRQQMSDCPYHCKNFQGEDKSYPGEDKDMHAQQASDNIHLSMEEELRRASEGSSGQSQPNDNSTKRDVPEPLSGVDEVQVLTGMHEVSPMQKKFFKKVYGHWFSAYNGHVHKRKHIRGMENHRGKHGMKKYGKCDFFNDGSALVPICISDDENPVEADASYLGTTSLENVTTQNNNHEAVSSENEGITIHNQHSKTNNELEDDTSTKTKEQGTQTTGIMEIVIEDQEALTAAIRIVNKFL